MSSENVIHIKLDYMESLKAKKGILSSQLTAISIGKKISRYKELRMQELDLKTKMYNKMKEVRSSIRRLQIALPNPTMPKLLKKEEHMEKIFYGKTNKGEEKVLHDESSIESQLREIQRRLEGLSG